MIRFKAYRWILALGLVMAPCAALAAADTRPAEAQIRHSTSFLQLLMKGGWFMVPIAIASLVGLALILERSLALRRSRIFPRGFMDELTAADDPAQAIAYCRRHPSPISRVMEAALKKLPDGPAAVERALEDAGGNEVHKLRRNLRMMYGLSVAAPMMGLLGTVWGMIDAFRSTTESQALGHPERLATGIYEALVTTLAGLMVAIPVLLLYYYFSGRVEAAVVDMNAAAAEFLDRFLEAAKDRPTLNTRSTER